MWTRPHLSLQLLKRERIKRKIYATRDEAKTDVFDYIELFYNPKRRHGNNGGLPPWPLNSGSQIMVRRCLQNQGRFTRSSGVP
jgi:transposase InsO family protein